jgi:oxygen-independent coproporphyrinogen-3 oxidase
METKTDANAKLKLLDTAMTKASERTYYARVSENPLTGAFEKKSVVHAGLGGSTVNDSEIRSLWSSLMKTERKGKTAAYIHIPFCETRCLYCGFFANAANKDLQKSYTDSLIRELSKDKDFPAIKSGPIHALYLGGGTPTVLETPDLRRLLEAARSCLPLANDCEITVEGRISNFDDEKIDACIQGGANRFSLGVQSFDTDIRRRMDRVEDKEGVISRLEKLRSTDQASIIIDLIFGLPGQTMEHWERDIQTFLDLEIDGVDLYQLIQFPGGRLKKAIDDNRLPPAADTAERARMFARGVEIMKSARYNRLSISHWGRTFRERNQYNLFMKAKKNCLAFGSGSGGYLFGYANFQEGKLKTYLEKAGKEKPIIRMLKPAGNEELVRLVAGELELGRINLSRAGRRLDMDLEEIYKPLISNWEEAGLVKLEDGWMPLTLAGEFWQTNLAQGMIDFYRETGRHHEIFK